MEWVLTKHISSCVDFKGVQLIRDHFLGKGLKLLAPKSRDHICVWLLSTVGFSDLQRMPGKRHQNDFSGKPYIQWETKENSIMFAQENVKR